MEWKFQDDTPLYLQIMEQMKMRIAAGEFQANEKLPSVRELALEAGVNPNTMQKALSELEREGYVYSPAHGRKICGRTARKAGGVERISCKRTHGTVSCQYGKNRIQQKRSGITAYGICTAVKEHKKKIESEAERNEHFS